MTEALQLDAQTSLTALQPSLDNTYAAIDATKAGLQTRLDALTTNLGVAPATQAALASAALVLAGPSLQTSCVTLAALTSIVGRTKAGVSVGLDGQRAGRVTGCCRRRPTTRRRSASRGARLQANFSGPAGDAAPSFSAGLSAGSLPISIKVSPLPAKLDSCSLLASIACSNVNNGRALTGTNRDERRRHGLGDDVRKGARAQPPRGRGPGTARRARQWRRIGPRRRRVGAGCDASSA